MPRFVRPLGSGPSVRSAACSNGRRASLLVRCAKPSSAGAGHQPSRVGKRAVAVLCTLPNDDTIELEQPTLACALGAQCVEREIERRHVFGRRTDIECRPLWTMCSASRSATRMRTAVCHAPASSSASHSDSTSKCRMRRLRGASTGKRYRGWLRQARRLHLRETRNRRPSCRARHHHPRNGTTARPGPAVASRALDCDARTPGARSRPAAPARGAARRAPRQCSCGQRGYAARS